MADSNFTVKNTLVVNTGFIANSSAIRVGSINSTSNGIWSNVTTITIGNSSVNATINSTFFSGTANNALYLGGRPADYYASNADVISRINNIDLTPYQRNDTLAANVLTLAARSANSSTWANGSFTNTFTIGTAAYVITSGNVGIGTSTPAYKLDVSGFFRARGDIYSTKGESTYFGPSDNYNLRLGTGLVDRAILDTSSNFTAYGNITAYSDENLKTDIETITNALEKVCRMRGVMYTRIDTETRGSGVIAQEMQEVLPEVVLDSNEYLSVAYGNIVGVLIEAIKELKAEIDELKGK